MFNSIFSKKEKDLDGKAFKQKFETTDKTELIDIVLRRSSPLSSIVCSIAERLVNHCIKPLLTFQLKKQHA